MKRHLWIYLLLIVFVFPLNSSAQRWKLKRYEAGVGLGSSNSWTDIGLRNNYLGGLQFLGTRPSVTLDLRYIIDPVFSVTVNFNYAMLGGQNVDGDGRYPIYFNTHVYEPSARFEYYLINNIRSRGTSALFNKRGMVNNYNNFALYGFAGVGGIFYKPNVRSLLDDELYIASDVNTNSGAALVFPVGIGMKYTLDAYWVIGLEFGAHITLTDYLDGYASQFSQHNDLFYLTSIKAIYKIRTGRNGLPVFKRYGN